MDRVPARPTRRFDVKKLDSKKNPHMLQLKHEKVTDCLVYDYTSIPRVLTADFPRKPYTQTPHKSRSVLHWGQRKLLLSEIEFLSLFAPMLPDGAVLPDCVSSVMQPQTKSCCTSSCDDGGDTLSKTSHASATLTETSTPTLTTSTTKTKNSAVDGSTPDSSASDLATPINKATTSSTLNNNSDVSHSTCTSERNSSASTTSSSTSTTASSTTSTSASTSTSTSASAGETPQLSSPESMPATETSSSTPDSSTQGKTDTLSSDAPGQTGALSATAAVKAGAPANSFYDTIVVYAGAAPGTHIPFLASLYPHLKFVLVDPAEFYVTPTEQIDVRREFFTDETVQMLKASHPEAKFLFISDIRTADPKTLSPAEVEVAVLEDMNHQMKWHLSLEPKASMFKFRLPWATGMTPYLKGQIFLPIWGRETTTESRLIVQGSELCDYDNKLYEEQMFHFNRLGRVQYHINPCIKHVVGMDHCYDCLAEVFVAKQYLSWANRDTSVDSLASMCNKFSQACSSNRLLSDKESFDARCDWFEAKRYDYTKGTVTVVSRKTAPSTHSNNSRNKRSRL
ncbi:poly A polymerase regulatory subunit [Pelomyxa schiedti]|nr:poly A polymerase regulatory subunit [Pelomyxa schiedti]